MQLEVNGDRLHSPSKSYLWKKKNGTEAEGNHKFYWTTLNPCCKIAAAQWRAVVWWMKHRKPLGEQFQCWISPNFLFGRWQTPMSADKVQSFQSQHRCIDHVFDDLNEQEHCHKTHTHTHKLTGQLILKSYWEAGGWEAGGHACWACPLSLLAPYATSGSQSSPGEDSAAQGTITDTPSHITQAVISFTRINAVHNRTARGHVEQSASN